MSVDVGDLVEIKRVMGERVTWISAIVVFVSRYGAIGVRYGHGAHDMPPPGSWRRA